MVAFLFTVARMAHEANRAYCISIGDNSQLPWSQAPDWQQKSAQLGVKFHIENPKAGAGASHQAWYDHKLAEGWSYDPVKDPANKKHPCIVPFEELPIEQQIKGHIFRSVVHGMLELNTNLTRPA